MIKRKVRPRKRRVSKNAAIERRLDDLWGKKVMARTLPGAPPGGCWGRSVEYGFGVRCLEQAVDPHHVVYRRFKMTRWLVENGVPLCRACHDWAHENQIKFDAWYDSIMGANDPSGLDKLRLFWLSAWDRDYSRVERELREYA